MSEPLGLGIEEPPDHHGAFPRLDDEQRARLRELGTVETIAPGDVLFREGDPTYDFFVIESGAIAIVRGYGDENRVIAVHGQHRFLGELNLLTGASVYLSAVVRDPGEVIRVPLSNLFKLLREDEDFANIVLRAFLSRRSILIEIGGGVRLVGSRYSRDTLRLREFLARNRVPYQFEDLEADEEAETMLRNLGIEAAETPVLIGGQHVLRNPSNSAAGSMLGIGARGAPPAMCDLVIVGGGPAGLAAAVYGASEGLDTQAIDAVALRWAGEHVLADRELPRVPGRRVRAGAGRARDPAGQEVRCSSGCTGRAAGLERENGHFTITLAGGGEVRGRTVIVATGAQYRRLDIPDLERYEGNGVYYAATRAEAQLCEHDPVLIVGGGNSAGQAALYLSEYGSSCKLADSWRGAGQVDVALPDR